MIKKIKANLSKNILLYTLTIMLLGVSLGYFFDLKFLSKFIISVVFIMIYPMMINLSLTSLKQTKGLGKPVAEALILNFIVAPLLMWFLAWLFRLSPDITLSLMLLSIAPASSMGLGYIGLSKGHMLSGTIIVAFAFLLSVFVYPVLGHYFALGGNIQVPFSLITKNLLFILVLPLVLGILTREYIERRHGAEKFLKAKLYFSVTTLASLYLLMFIIFASKAKLILQNYQNIFLLFPVALFFYGAIVLVILFLNKKVFKFEYGYHQSVVFTAVSKNIALTIAILVSVFGEKGQYLAVFPAIMSLFQAPFLMIYLKSSKKIRHWFEK